MYNLGLLTANNINEVKRSYSIGDTAYFSKNLDVVWIKNTRGEVRTFELNEIIEKDEKDLQIELLQAQINELKERINNEQYDEHINKSTEDEESSSISTNTRNKKDKWKS